MAGEEHPDNVDHPDPPASSLSCLLGDNYRREIVARLRWRLIMAHTNNVVS
jgi:hypothetical protein